MTSCIQIDNPYLPIDAENHEHCEPDNELMGLLECVK